MTWTTEFIDLALNGLPKDKYRKRIQAELTDHLLELETELETSGLAPEAAQARALELMGDPSELNPAFRESWGRRASSWKYCLGALCKAAIHTVLVNSLTRWLVCMPILLAASRQLFEFLRSVFPFSIFLFSLVNFLPGLWFCARELSERFAIHPHRQKLLLCGLVMAWFFESLPFLSTIIHSSVVLTFLGSIIILPMLLGQFPLAILSWASSNVNFDASVYFLFTLILSVLFALFYRPKSSKPFLLSDKK